MNLKSVGLMQKSEDFWMNKQDMEIKSVRNKLNELQERMNPKPRIRHLEEITVVQSIFCDDRCAEYSDGHLDIECIFDIQSILAKKEFQVSYVYENPKNCETPVDFGSIFVEYLPSIRFYLKLPASYPTKLPPDYTLDIAWLPTWESSKICQKLDELWEENQGSEILFIWIDFLKNRLFDFLGMREKLDVSYLFSLNKDKGDSYYTDVIRMRDLRVSRPVNKCPIQYLEKFDKAKRQQRFKQMVHFCGICLEQKTGSMSLELANCRHVFCRNCLQQYLNSKIRLGSVKGILCPKNDCSKQIEFKEKKEICDEKMFKRLEELLLKKTLDTMKDTVPCARKICQYPVIRENVEDNLATCANCSYSFCVYCRKVYHGVSPCEMTKAESTKLINEYQNASNKGKKLLELRYGKKQIEIVVERFLTQEYLKENAKPCPNCLTPTTKIHGCNKMSCTYCEKNFCWLCGHLIEEEDPYQHYSIKNHNACVGRLFDGAIPDDDLLDEIEIEANLAFFQM